MTLSPPTGEWSPRGTLLALALGVVLAPAVAGLALLHDGQLHDLLVVARTVVVGAAMLVTAGLLAGHARFAGNDHTVVLSTVFGVFAALGLAGAARLLMSPEAAQAQRVVALTLSTLVVLGTLSITTAARRSGSRRPLVLGLPLVVATLVAQQAAWTSPPARGPGLVPLLGGLLLVSAAALALELWRLDALPRWARSRFAAAVLLCAVSVAVAALPGPQTLCAIVALVLGSVGALVSATTAIDLVRELLADTRRQIVDLRQRLSAAELEHRADSARLHDINSLVAGVTSAYRLINDLPPSNHRAGLEAMVLAELERLQRLLADRRRTQRVGPSGELCVEEVLSRIALSHRSRGRVVTTHLVDRGGLRVTGDADDLAQLLDILVENAAQHGTADDITLEVRPSDAGVALSVTDRGPGVPRDLLASVFEWGRRGPASTGSGIGLFTARVLASGLGGTIRVAPTDSGACFVLDLPVSEPALEPAEEERTLVRH